MRTFHRRRASQIRVRLLAILAVASGAISTSTWAQPCPLEWIPSSEVPQQFNCCFEAIATHDADGAGGQNARLIVGSWFTFPGGIVRQIVAWDDVAWQPVGDGVNGQVRALVSWHRDGPEQNPVLVAGGRFFYSGGTLVNHVAVWDGAS